MKSKDGKFDFNSNNFTFLLIGIAIIGALGYFSYKYAFYLNLVNGVQNIVLLVGFLIAVGIVFLGVLGLINNMYMSSDIEILITFPFSATQIAVLRVLSFFRIALIVSVLVLIAPCAGYCLKYPFPITTWVAVILTGILLTIFMTSVVASVVILLMTFLKIFHSRQALKVVGACLAFFALCGYLFLTSNSGDINMLSVFMSMTNIMDVIKYVIPVVGCAVNFIQTGNFLYLALEIVCALIASAVFFLIAKAFYLKGAMSMQDAGRGKLLTDADLDHYCQQKKVMKALISKEYRMVRRNPVYLLYNFIVGALWPVVVVLMVKKLIPILTSLMNEQGAKEFTSKLTVEGFVVLTIIISFIMMIIVSLPLSMQTIAFSSLSREGNSFQIMKQLPIAYSVQIRAKRALASRISQISITGYSALILIAASILLKINFLYCIVPLIMVAVYTEFSVNLDMLMGISNTNVNWDNEKDATKKPLPVTLIDMLKMGFICACAGGLGYAYLSLDLNLYLCCVLTILLGVILAILSLILFKRILVTGEKKIRRLRF